MILSEFTDVLEEANVLVVNGSDATIKIEQNNVELEGEPSALTIDVLEEEPNVQAHKSSDAFNIKDHNGIELKEKLSELTNIILGEANVQVVKGSDDFIEIEQNAIEIEVILSEGAKETRVTADDSTDRTSNTIGVQVREGSETVLLFDDVNASGNVSEAWRDSETILPLDNVIDRLNKLKVSRAASNDSAAYTSNVFEVKKREVSRAVLTLDDANVNSNVFEVREDSEAATINVTNVVLEEGKGSDAFIEDEQDGVEFEENSSEFTNDIVEEPNVQVDKGSDAFIEDEQDGIELEEILSELVNFLKEANVQVDKVSDAFIENEQYVGFERLSELNTRMINVTKTKGRIEHNEKQSLLTNDVPEEANVRVHKGSDAFIENEQYGVEIEEKLLELSNEVLEEANVRVVKGSDAFIEIEQNGMESEVILSESTDVLEEAGHLDRHFETQHFVQVILMLPFYWSCAFLTAFHSN
jgi:hypothetical protein